METTARRMTLKEWMDREGFSRKELIEEMANNYCAPALCTCGKWVELDGTCEHGNPAASLIMMGFK